MLTVLSKESGEDINVGSNTVQIDLILFFNRFYFLFCLTVHTFICQDESQVALYNKRSQEKQRKIISEMFSNENS